jgi:hypothetical protein
MLDELFRIFFDLLFKEFLFSRQKVAISMLTLLPRILRSSGSEHWPMRWWMGASLSLSSLSSLFHSLFSTSEGVVNLGNVSRLRKVSIVSAYITVRFCR